MEPGVVLPLGNGLSARVLQPGLDACQSAEESQLQITLSERRNYSGVVHTGDILHFYPQFFREIVGEHLETPGQTGGVLVGNTAYFKDWFAGTSINRVVGSRVTSGIISFITWTVSAGSASQ